MGKEESAESTEENEAGSDASTSEDTTKTKEQSTPENNTAPETAEKPTEEKKEDVESLRTVIKVNEEEAPAEEKKEESPPDDKKTKNETKTDDVADMIDIPEEKTTGAPADSREDLEQRRNILQSIKDFDFQIKKNQEDVSKTIERIDGLTKDLDDLVSLYEIVSEQMNPFVGLSKVTKKRIDALENFTQEIEDVKTRMGDVESVLEKNKVVIGEFKKRTTSTDAKKSDTETEETPSEIVSEPESELEEKTAIETEDLPSETVIEPEVHIEEAVIEPAASDTTQFVAGDLSDEDLDKILSESLAGLLAEQNIDSMINEFLLSLK